MFDDGCFFFLLHSDELRKTSFLRTLIKLAHEASEEAVQMFMADAVEMVVFVLQVSNALWKRIHLLSHFRRVYHDILAGSINFLETLQRMCKRKTVTLYKELCSI